MGVAKLIKIIKRLPMKDIKILSRVYQGYTVFI